MKIKPILSESVLDTYYSRLYITPPPKPRYLQSRLGVGINVRTGKKVFLDTKDAFSAIVIGKRGSGKSFLTRGMADRLIQTKRSVAYIQDVKDEYKSSRYPVQLKFASSLQNGEEPKGQPIITFRPTFFKQLPNAKLAKLNHWFSIALDDMQQSDLFTLLNVNKMTNPQKLAMQTLFTEVKKQGGIENMQTLLDVLENSEKIEPVVKNKLKLKLLPIIDSHIDEADYQYDIVKILKDGYHPSFNLKEYDSISPDGGFDYPSMFIGIMLRKLINARRQRKIDPLVVMFDEVLQVINNDKDNVAKKITYESVIRDRAENISYVFVVQNLAQFPEKITKQCRYIFIPRNLSMDDFKKILRQVGFGGAHHMTLDKKAYHWHREMRQHEYSWMLIDTDGMEPIIFTPFAPLSHHMETSN